ncbi:MAG: TonB-dependent receptor [Gammaproteobacteria bacterium]|nr:TonB-dependent receptor [Gammaproteobacteria bacterium]
MQRHTNALPALVTIIVAGVLSCAAATRADEGVAAEKPVEQITVVAHKDRRSIRNVAANVTALSRDALKNDLATSLNAVFRYVPGVDYEAAGTRFGTEGINIRGIGGNRVAILIDGVSLSDQFDVGSFSNATRDFIDAGLIQSIEVLHGPSSALYGSSAIGGVVAARTPDPFELSGMTGHGGDALVTWHGEDSSRHGKVLTAIGGPERGLLLGASWRDGEQADSAAADAAVDTRNYARRTGLVKFVTEDRLGGTWRMSLLHQDSEIDSSLTSLLGTGRYRSTTALLGDDSYQMDMVNVSYDFVGERQLFDTGVARVFYQDAEIRQFTLDERANARTPVSIDRFFSFAQQTQGFELNLWKDLTGDVVAHRIGFGLAWRDHLIEEYRDGLQTTLGTGEQTKDLLGEVFPLRDFPISNTVEAGVYIEDSMSFGDWVVIAAVRADRFELKPRLDSMYAEDYPFSTLVPLTESDVSPKLGLIYQVNDAIDIYAQYSHGFRAPPYADANIGLEIPLFNVRAIPNPDLTSESSDGLELGLRVVVSDATARLAVFQTRYEDFIESKVRLGADPDSGRILFQSQNLRETEIKGVEGAVSWRFGEQRSWGFDLSAFYAEGRNRETGEPLNSVGPPQAVVGLNWYSTDERRQLRLKAILTDDWSGRDASGGPLVEPSGYAVLDFYLMQRLGRQMSVRAGLHNLADKTYWHWADVRGLSPDDPMLPYLARAGRSASLSVNVNW